MTMNPSRLDTGTFLTPTTCFTIACVSFTLVALSTIRVNSSATRTKVSQTDLLLPVLQRRTENTESREVTGEAQKREHKTAISNEPRSQILELLLLIAKVTDLLRSCQHTSELKVLVVSLLNQLSLVTASLCRLQQEVVLNPSFLSNGVGLAACFGSARSALQATLSSVETTIGNDLYELEVLRDALQQLKDQNPVLEFLLSIKDTPSAPPTPPSETKIGESLESELVSYPHAADDHAGTTPTGNDKSWAEPPPEYSPPADSNALPAPEKLAMTEEPLASPEEEEEEENISVHNPLLISLKTNNNEKLAELLEGGADPNAPFGDLQRTALHQAANLNRCGCLALLLKYGAIMSAEDAKGDTALHLAAWAGNVEALSILLAHGADVDWLSGRDTYSPLWCAISAHQIDTARLLLKHGARVNLRAASGGSLTPLHQAASTCQTAMCELLLDRGAQVDSLDDDENTPLHYAAASGSAGSVAALLRSGADIEARQTHGLTAIHWAAHKGHIEVLSILLSYGASVEVRAAEGATPLHLAANRGQLTAARMLLEKGASRWPNYAKWDGMEGTPADMAKAKGHLKLAKLL